VRHGSREAKPASGAVQPDFRRSPTHARVVIDGREVATDTHNALHAGALDVNLGGVLRVFPLAREPGALHFQAGAIPPAHMIANLPALIAGRAIRSPRLRDVSGREMVIEAAQQPLSPIIDGERFTDITRLVVRAGPKVRIAVPGSSSRQ
jgi:diacylglycerol kinase family enzyme